MRTPASNLTIEQLEPAFPIPQKVRSLRNDIQNLDIETALSCGVCDDLEELLSEQTWVMFCTIAPGQFWLIGACNNEIDAVRFAETHVAHNHPSHLRHMHFMALTPEVLERLRNWDESLLSEPNVYKVPENFRGRR